jgi:N-methylhydantoinase B
MHYNQFAFVPDTEGAGMHRGGLATVREWEIESEEAQLQMRTDRTRTKPWGLGGGQPGAHSRTSVVLGGRERDIGKETLMMKRGDILRLQTAGAGGWGDPRARAPAAVLRDVVEGKVSRERARDVYNVDVADAPGIRGS